MGKVTVAVAVEFSPDIDPTRGDAFNKELMTEVLRRASKGIKCPKEWSVDKWQVKTLSRTVAAKARHARNRKGKK